MKENFEIWSDGLTKVYDKGKKQTLAVDHINLRIESGIHGFLGPNGAGKTTTINMLMGAVYITEGEAYIRGRKAGTNQAKSLIGFLPQDPKFYRKMTALDYLLYTGKLYGFKNDFLKQKATELIEYFELDEDMEKPISKYSGGMKQKVGLASALIHDPKLLILDEPTTNLDPLGRNSIINYIKTLAEEDISIFVSSHILSEIEQMCDKVTIIDHGRIISTDTISNIKKRDSRASNLFILDTSSNQTILNDLETIEIISKAWINEKDNKINIVTKEDDQLQSIILELVNKHKLLIKSFYKQEASLQDVFLNLVKNGDDKK
jgi:ABC-2 type transport system ATP-binding protein